MAMVNPPHPGDFIKTEIVEAHGLSVTAAAAALGVSRPTLQEFAERQGGTVGGYGAADREGVRGEDGYADADGLIAAAYEIWQTRKREGRIRVKRVVCAAC